MTNWKHTRAFPTAAPTFILRPPALNLLRKNGSARTDTGLVTKRNFRWSLTCQSYKVIIDSSYNLFILALEAKKAKQQKNWRISMFLALDLDLGTGGLLQRRRLIIEVRTRRVLVGPSPVCCCARTSSSRRVLKAPGSIMKTPGLSGVSTAASTKLSKRPAILKGPLCFCFPVMLFAKCFRSLVRPKEGDIRLYVHTDR